jgi:hypothetical protein
MKDTSTDHPWCSRPATCLPTGQRPRRPALRCDGLRKATNPKMPITARSTAPDSEQRATRGVQAMSIKEAVIAQARAERVLRCKVHQAIAGIRFSETKRSVPASNVKAIGSGPWCRLRAIMEGAMSSVRTPSKAWTPNPSPQERQDIARLLNRHEGAEGVGSVHAKGPDPEFHSLSIVCISPPTFLSRGASVRPQR